MRAILATEYAKDYDHFLERAVDGLVASDAIMGRLPPRRVRHQAAVRHHSGESPLDHRMTEMGRVHLLNADDLREGDIDAHTAMIAATAKSVLADAIPRFLEVVTEIHAASGHDMPSAGSVWEAYLQNLARVEMQFHDDGTPYGATVFVNPDTGRLFEETPMPPDFLDRARAIMDENRKRFFAQKRTRRLSSRPPQ